GIQAWISDGSIDYEMYLAIQREARIFFQHEAMFAEYAENPSQEVVDTITEKYFQALKRPTEDPSKK
ncbi:hypothetical protein MMC26_000498, partial [Xylographa opegraphella]|nr:hypothetical protein [Xylographa opegraphella]